MASTPYGSRKSGIKGDGMTAIQVTPSGKLRTLLSRSADVVGYDFRNGSVYTMHDHNRIARLVEGNDGNVYLYNPVSQWESNSWLKLDKANGDTLVARFPQVLYTEDGENYYAFPLFYDAKADTYAPKELDADNYVAESRFVYKDGVLTQLDDALIGQVMGDYQWMDAGDSHLVVAPVDVPQNRLPDSLADKLSTYIISYDKGGSDPVSVVVKGVTDGGKVYLSNPLSSDNSQWIIGQINGDKAVFTTNQYLGPDTVKTNYHQFFHAASFTRKDSVDYEGNNVFHYDYAEQPSVTLSYDAAQDEYVAQANEAFVISKGADVKGYAAPAFYAYQEKAATPKDPYFSDFQMYNNDYGYGIFNFVLPTLDTNKKYLNPDHLYYCFYLDDSTEPCYLYKTDYIKMQADSMNIFPANYSDGYDMAPLDENVHQVYYYFADFDRLGVQSIYRAAGEERRSNIAWITYRQATGVEKVTTDAVDQPAAVEYYDLQGRRLDHPASGVVIRRARYTNGRVVVSKMIRK